MAATPVKTGVAPYLFGQTPHVQRGVKRANGLSAGDVTEPLVGDESAKEEDR